MNLQKGKAPCVIGTVAHHRKLEEIYNLGTITHKKISLKPNFLSSFLLFYNILSSLIQIRLLFQTFQHFSFSFYSCPAVGLFERMYPWCCHVQSSDIAEKPTKIASDDDPEYLPDTFSTLLSLVSSAKIFQVIVEILLQCFSAQYTVNTEFFIWNRVFDDKLFFTKSGINLIKEKPNLKVSFLPHVSA